jgi:hypothetical protein
MSLLDSMIGDAREPAVTLAVLECNWMVSNRKPAYKKISDDDLDYLRKLRESGVSHSDIGKLFGVSRVQVWRILSGKSRSWDREDHAGGIAPDSDGGQG